MKVWHFSELAYYPAWEELGAQLRNVVPSRLCEPEIAADLYHRGLDEWALCDELGLNIMVNEHHATATCIDSVSTISMAILPARRRKRACCASECLSATVSMRCASPRNIRCWT